MRPRTSLLFLSIIAAALVLGCTDDSTELKQKIAVMETKLQKQEKDIKDFSGKFAPPKDFSADIQRIEDQQDKISQILKTKVDPVNSKLEEFRDWAQEAQKERDAVNKKLKALDQHVSEMGKKLESANKEFVRLSKDAAGSKKSDSVAAGLTKNVEDLSKGLAEVRKEVLDNNSKLVNAVKKTLPKVKEAALAELKGSIAPLEQGLASLKTEFENERKGGTAGKTPSAAAATDSAGKEKDAPALMKRIRELEEVVTAQKSYLLEVGSKVHELEIQLRQDSSSLQLPPAAMLQRN
jgi:chromosome segregation ATPase